MYSTHGVSVVYILTSRFLVLRRLLQFFFFNTQTLLISQNYRNSDLRDNCLQAKSRKYIFADTLVSNGELLWVRGSIYTAQNPRYCRYSQHERYGTLEHWQYCTGSTSSLSHQTFGDYVSYWPLLGSSGQLYTVHTAFLLSWRKLYVLKVPAVCQRLILLIPRAPAVCWGWPLRYRLHAQVYPGSILQGGTAGAHRVSGA